MKTIGNIIWFLLIGLWSAIGYAIGGLLFCITIIGIPLGKQLFKLAHLVIFPFGKNAEINPGKHPVANILWAIFFGWEMFLGYIFTGVIFCITIIGIPFGKQCFKLAFVALLPFGAKVN